MRAIEAHGLIDENGNLVIPMPAGIPAGEYHVVIVLDLPEQPLSQPTPEPEKTPKLWPPAEFKVFEAGLIDPDATPGREGLYETDRG